MTVYDEYWKIINQGSAFFFSPNLILSARHVFWKADMRNACFAKVTTYGKSTTDFSVLSVIIDDADSDLIILSVEGNVPLMFVHTVCIILIEALFGCLCAVVSLVLCVSGFC